MARALFPLPDPGVRRIQPVFQILRRQRHRCLRDRKQPIHHRDESLFVRRGSGRHAQFRYEKLAHQLLRTPEKSRQHRIDLQGHGGRLQIHGDGDIRGNGRPARHHHGELLHPDPRFRGHRLVGRPGDLPEQCGRHVIQHLFLRRKRQDVFGNAHEPSLCGQDRQ